jgi:hypothetical protein
MLAAGSVAAEDATSFETFLTFYPTQDDAVAREPVDTTVFVGLTDVEMIALLYEMSAAADQNPDIHAEMAIEPPRQWMLDRPGGSFEKRPALPPPLLVAGMAAQAIHAVDTGTCDPCSFGENIVTRRRGFDIRWKVPIDGYPNAYLYKAFADIPLDPGGVVQIPWDTDMIVEAARRVFSVIQDPSLVIDSYYESGSGINFYYWFSYDLGEGPRAFYTWEIRVMELG